MKKFAECEEALAAGGAVSCPALKGAFVTRHPDGKRDIIVYPKGHAKYPGGTVRLWEEEGNERAFIASNWQELKLENKEG